MTEIKRKGARSIADIPQEILKQLNSGKTESVNLVEWLAINQKELLENVLNETKRRNYLSVILSDIDNLKKSTVNTINEAIGIGLFTQAMQKKDTDFLQLIASHTSDAVRCWATYTIGRNSKLSIKQQLSQIQPFAADTHFGVREIAWIAVRPSIAKNLQESITILTTWTKHKNENIRRFASESTRPRGVWCEHIDLLKQNPNLALPILESLKTDKHKYVQDSVGNWLNDASKTQPKFVTDICKRWQKENNTKETEYIVKKALRTLNK